MLTLSNLPSPLGNLVLALHDGRPCVLAFHEHGERAERTLRRRFGASAPVPASCPDDLRARLARYFRASADALDGVALDPGGTPFQRAVWDALRAVPFGQTTSYSEIARSLGSPGAARAVGAACAANPLWLLVPCHRAVGSHGELVGFAAGLERKSWLLSHEAGRRAHPPHRTSCEGI